MGARFKSNTDTDVVDASDLIKRSEESSRTSGSGEDHDRRDVLPNLLRRLVKTLSQDNTS